MSIVREKEMDVGGGSSELRIKTADTPSDYEWRRSSTWEVRQQTGKKAGV
jgi:hypothetical protein